MSVIQSCLMCDHDDWGWFEVLRETCGVCEPWMALKNLCDKHRTTATAQLMEKFKDDPEEGI